MAPTSAASWTETVPDVSLRDGGLFLARRLGLETSPLVRERGSPMASYKIASAEVEKCWHAPWRRARLD